MAIGNYLKEIGRGKDGARALSREQSFDLMAQILDGNVSDLEIGAFCIAMRIKGETPIEMAGFLDAIHNRSHKLSQVSGVMPAIVIPSYNGARKLPGLTALLAMLLAREGFPVVIHGTPTEDRRVFTTDILRLLGVDVSGDKRELRCGEVLFLPTSHICMGLQRLLEVRKIIQLRNPAHSLVKLMNPCVGTSIVISSYTHPEYAQSMAQTVGIMDLNCMILRGTEGECVADPRRTPKMDLYQKGSLLNSIAAQTGSLLPGLELPTETTPEVVADYTANILGGNLPVPLSIAQQVSAIQVLASELNRTSP